MAGWCVDPDYRSYGHPLHARAISRREVVYFTVTPAPHTLPTLAAVGYRRYSEGQVIFAPLLSRGEAGRARRRHTRPTARRRRGYATRRAAARRPRRARLLRVHRPFRRQARPLIFQPRRIWRERIPCVHLDLLPRPRRSCALRPRLRPPSRAPRPPVRRRRRCRPDRRRRRALFCRARAALLQGSAAPPRPATSPTPNW